MSRVSCSHRIFLRMRWYPNPPTAGELVLISHRQEHGFEIDSFFEPHVLAWLRDTEDNNTHDWVSRAVGMDSVCFPLHSRILSLSRGKSGFPKARTSIVNPSSTYSTSSVVQLLLSYMTCLSASTSGLCI